MGIRDRKNHLLTVLKAHLRFGEISKDQADAFERMYRQARTAEEQDQVTAALKHQIDGWKTDSDRYSKVLRDVFEEPEEDDDPPSLKAALARSQITFLRK